MVSECLPTPAPHKSAFDGLVARLYRAATGATGWREPLMAIQRAFGAVTAVLHSMDMARGGQLVALEYGGESPRLDEAVLTYLRDWHPHDPRRQRFLEAGPDAVGRWADGHEAFDEAFVQRHRIFQHCMHGDGGRFNAIIVLPVTDSMATAFVLELPRERGPLGDRDRRHVERLAMHLE